MRRWPIHDCWHTVPNAPGKRRAAPASPLHPTAKCIWHQAPLSHASNVHLVEKRSCKLVSVRQEVELVVVARVVCANAVAELTPDEVVHGLL